MFFELLEKYEQVIKESGVEIDERAHIDRVAFADWLNNHAAQQPLVLDGVRAERTMSMSCPHCNRLVEIVLLASLRQ